MDRYNVSKLLEVFYTRELAARAKQSGKPDVIINFANPGLCTTGLTKDLPFPLYQVVKVLKFLIARTPEEGSRVFLYATQSEPETHGEFVTNARVEP